MKLGAKSYIYMKKRAIATPSRDMPFKAYGGVIPPYALQGISPIPQGWAENAAKLSPGGEK
jgi:hypothetical protein